MRTERANAKINTYLNVIARRENGYHDIVSIMQTVSLCDLVSVNFHPTEHTSVSLRASGNAQMPTDCRNLAWRAAEKFLQATRRRGEVQIIIEKHIPMAAGLAGGSADAAAVLRALNVLCDRPLSTEELCALGSTLGADVPFCIRGGSARVTGIGDKMAEFPSMPDAYLVVACRGEGVSTPWAYGELDRKYEGFSAAREVDMHHTFIENAWKNGDLRASCEHFFNLFEEVVPTVQKDVDPIKEAMLRHGAMRAMMSGSGPSVFGIFEDASKAEAARDAISALGLEAFVCRPISR